MSGPVPRWRSVWKTSCAPTHEADVKFLTADNQAAVWATTCTCGINGLRVVDASIFPTVPRADTNIPTIAAAEFIAGRLKRLSDALEVVRPRAVRDP
ncbi:MAG: GMC oxidoreductase [Actinomycetota bacterium]|nr:GMC oxidoreductase [Actinomycetota bacterium]